MREGLKMTPIGLLPNDWETGMLGEYLDYIQPTNYITKEFYEEGNTPVLTANKAFILGYTDETVNVFTDVPVIIFDDFTTDSKFVDFPFKVRSSALKILVYKNKDFDINYIYESLKSINYQSTEHKRYWISEYQYLRIPIPPLPEQQKIANILSTVDAKIEIISQQITETQELKKGLMQRLLTKGIGHTEFKDSPLGEIPKSWEIMTGEEISKLITKGASPKWQGFDYQEDGLLFVTSENVRNGLLDISNPKFLPLKFNEKVKKSKLKNGDILINIVGASIGRSCRYYSKYEYANINQAICLLRIKEFISAEFILQYLQGNDTINRLLDAQNGSARQNLSLTDIRKFKFVIPQIKEQNNISEILSCIDEKLNLLSEKKTTYQELKQGLMQQLLTGKVRVKV